MCLIFPQDPNTREYLQLALARVLELQREIEEGTYVTEINNGNGDLGKVKLQVEFALYPSLAIA